jgi:fatty acid desaturase
MNVSVSAGRSIEAIASAPEFLNKARQLSSVNNWKAALAIARQWVIISCSLALALYFDTTMTYGIAIFVIATRQHALAILFHDAAHYRLFSNRELNDFCGNVLCGLPSGVILSRFRDDHLKHHWMPNTDQDPYWIIYTANPRNWVWPKTRSNAFKVFLFDLVGLNTPKTVQEFSSWLPWQNHFSRADKPKPLKIGERLSFYVFAACLVIFLTFTGSWTRYLVFWIIPLFTITQFLLRLRTIAEHSALTDSSGTDETRHVDGHWIERLSICPLNINYHVAHHLFPNIPYYNLPKMHKILTADSEFRSRAHLRKTYLAKGGVLWEELIDRRLLPRLGEGSILQ